MAIVVCNPKNFRQDFPQFADPVKYPDRRLKGAFTAATLGLDNSDSSPVPYEPGKKIFTREVLLYFVTCHILTLADWAVNGQAGPVTTASEGSVSAGCAAPQMKSKS